MEEHEDAKPAGPTNTITVLGQQVDVLAAEAAGLRSEVTRIRRRCRSNIVASVALGLLLLYVFIDQRNAEQDSRRQHEQGLGLAVAVCGMQNVIRIEVGNFLSRAVNEGIFDIPGDAAASERRRTFLAQERASFNQIPCEALVAGEELTIRLEYPPTVPPPTVPG
jgi:hypothetical protein